MKRRGRGSETCKFLQTLSGGRWGKEKRVHVLESILSGNEVGKCKNIGVSSYVKLHLVLLSNMNNILK